MVRRHKTNYEVLVRPLGLHRSKSGHSLSALGHSDRGGRSHTTLHVRFAPESGQTGQASR